MRSYAPTVSRHGHCGSCAIVQSHSVTGRLQVIHIVQSHGLTAGRVLVQSGLAIQPHSMTDRLPVALLTLLAGEALGVARDGASLTLSVVRMS